MKDGAAEDESTGEVVSWPVREVDETADVAEEPGKIAVELDVAGFKDVAALLELVSGIEDALGCELWLAAADVVDRTVKEVASEG